VETTPARSADGGCHLAAESVARSKTCHRLRDVTRERHDMDVCALDLEFKQQIIGIVGTTCEPLAPHGLISLLRRQAGLTPSSWSRWTGGAQRSRMPG